MNTLQDTSSSARRDHGPLMMAVGMAALLVVVRAISPGVPDTGDGIAHYQHARYFWHEADAALSQWGKPVFSLLASPFALLGMWGMAAFGAVCAVATCAVIMAFLPGERRRMWAWAVPVLLFFAPIYVHTILSGLTEPLFGLASVIAVFFLWKERYAAAMVLLGLMPFIRPEYAAFAPFALAWIVWRKAWRALPWGFTGIVLYSIASGLLRGHPFAFFTDHTYAGNDIYGHGDGWLFYDNIDAIYGLPLKRAILLAVVAWAVLLWRDGTERARHFMLGTLTLLPAIAIFSLHSYAWGHGGMASLGLLRVIATTVPLLVLFTAYMLATVWAFFVPAATWSRVVFAAVVLVYGNTAYHELRDRERLPLADDDIQHTVREAAAYVNTHRRPGQRIFFLDPYVGALCDRDPWDMDSARFLYGMGSLAEQQGVRDGDWVVWDAHFAANEGGLELDTLLKDGRFRPVADFAPPTEIRVLGDRPFAVHVFQRDAEWTRFDTTLFVLGKPSDIHVEQCDTLDRSDNGFHFRGSAYPLSLADLPLLTDSLSKQELVVHVELDAEPLSTDTLLLAFTEHRNGQQVSYHHEALRKGTIDLRFPVPPNRPGTTGKLYLWNVTGRPFGLRTFSVSHEGLRHNPR